MKRTLTFAGLFLALAAPVAFFVWDAMSPAAPADGKIHLRYWTITGMKDVIPYYAESFGKAQDRIVVETTPIPWQEHEKKILTAIVSGNPADVINQVTPVPKWASRMALQPLDAYIARDRFDTTVFFPSLWDEMRWHGHIYAIPVYSGSYGLFFNKRLFREAGLDPERPPETWDDVRAMNERLTRRDEQGRIVRMGFIPNYGNVQTFMLMAWQKGARFLDESGTRVNFADSAAQAALDWVEDFYKRYPVDDVAAFMGGLGFADQHGFIAGKVAMMVLDSSFPDQIKAYRPDLEYGVAMVPHFEGSPSASVAGSWWLAIPRGAKEPEAAWEFIKHATGKEAQLREVEMQEESMFPANRWAAADPRFMRNQEREVFVQMMDFAHSPSVVPMAHDVFWREMFGAQERVIHGLQTPVVALRQAERVVQSSLDEALAYDRYVQRELADKQ
ncbi:ABC transporter substrate-binding protein [bacterium]|nr:MAG: ABC transporter substrate-binding protein [bacterium]